MGTDRPDEPERPTLERGDFYVYSDEDIAEAMAELFAVIREYDELTDDQAEAIVDYGYDLLTGDFAADPDS